ncbi:MAG: DUF3137 domain-containing protein [Patescibacteria group bacterium]|jgi:hypothetical protein
MTVDPREEAVRRAYEAARFDERTPDERGFAETFEKEIKPKLIAGVGFNRSVKEARLRRRKIAFALAVSYVVVSLFVLAILDLPDSGVGLQLFLFGSFFVGSALWNYAFMKRAGEEDPNNAAVIDAVLARFGCRMGSGFAKYVALPFAAPITPSYSDFSFVNEHLTGTFDERIPFVALRLTMKAKSGKSKITTFKGWYLNIELPFSFSGTTIIHERLSVYHRIPGGRNLGVVSLESLEYEKRFTVKSSNQTEARVILTPDVMHHLALEADRFASEGKGWNPSGNLMLGFSENRAHIWMPSRETALSVWNPLDPTAMIEGLHGAFEELAEMRAFLRDIDVIAESEGFRALAAKNGRSEAS